jgi:uncharacterized protein (DUF924 family)
MSSLTHDDVLKFWFPPVPETDYAALAARMTWWFRGRTNDEVVARFSTLTEQAARGELDGWAAQPHSRLALIIVLDQFSRTVYSGTRQAYAQDAKARAFARDGFLSGHYFALRSPWEKTFFMLPLGHSELLHDLDFAVELAEELAASATGTPRQLLEFSANQARSHREVVARFGRQPHRNDLLGRPSTADELAYLAGGELVHLRTLPRH